MRNRMMMVGLCSFTLMAALLGGCGESPELKLQRAQIALNSGKPDQAVQLTESVLKDKPDDPQALLLKGRAQLALLRMGDSRNTIDELIKTHPDLPEAHNLMADWAFRQMGRALGQSDFLTNPKLQTQFDQALALGVQQADWLEHHDKSPVDSLYLRARLADGDYIRTESLLRNAKSKLDKAKVEGSPDIDDFKQSVKDLQEKADARSEETQNHLKAVLAADPHHFDAAEMYARLLTYQEKWDELWALAQQISHEKDIPVTLYERLALSMMRIPDGVQPTADRLEAGWRLQDAVAAAGKGQPTWKITSARLHLLAGEYPKAQELLEQVCKVQPRNVDARYLLAQTYYSQGKFDLAKTKIEDLANEQHNSAQVQFLDGLILWKTKDYDSARDKLREASNLNPNDPRPQAALISLMAEKGEIAEASKEIDDSYAKDPSDPRIIRLKMQSLIVAGQRSDVGVLMGVVEKLSPLTDDHRRVLIDGYTYLQQFDKAEAYAEDLVKNEPNNVDAHMKLAETKLMLGKEAEVRQMLADLKTKFPNAAGVDQMLGRLYLQRGSFDKAHELLEKVVQQEPANVEARIMLARAEASLSLMDDAIEQLDKVLEISPNDARAHSMLARIYQLMRQPDKASYHLSKIDEDKIDERSNPALLAQIKLRKNEPNALEDAAAICNRAIAAGNTDVMIRMLLAEIYVRQKNFDQAETNLLAIVRTEPGNRQAWSVLTRFYVDQQKLDRGLNQLTMLQSLPDPNAEVLSRLAQATILAASGKADQAIDRITPVYAPMIKSRAPMTLVVADALAELHRVRHEPDAAYAVYEPLKAADFLVPQAMLRQADLVHDKESPEQYAARLDAIAVKITPDQPRLRYELMNRYAAINRFDRSLALLDQWIAQHPNDATLLRWKGDVLLQTNKPAEAIQVFDQAVKAAPDNALARERLASAYVANNDFPSAEKTLRDMAKMDTGTRITALTALGQMYVSLGLNHQAVATFDELEKAGEARDPRILFAIGQSFALLGRDNEAAQRLSLIPNYVTQYPAAQILLARIEQRQGKVADAKMRLEQLESEPRFTALIGQELLRLNLANAREQELLKWSDQALNTEKLPEALRKRWMLVRVALAANRRDWKAALEAIEPLSRLEPDSPQVAAVHAVLLLRLNRPEEASQYVTAASKLNTAPLLVLAMSQTLAASDFPKAGFPAFIAAMIRGDIPAARSAAEHLDPMRTVYRADLLALLDRPDATSPDMAATFRTLGLAVASYEAGLPQLTEELCEGVTAKLPSFAPAYGLLVQALFDQDKPADKVLAQVVAGAPTSSLALFLNARQKSSKKDYAGAATDLRSLLQREPQNVHVRYVLAQVFQSAGQFDQEIEELKTVAATPGTYHIIATNDLAYVLAEHYPDRRKEALQLAQAAIKEAPNFPQLLDTAGWAEHLSGDDKAALAHLCSALGSLSAVPDVQYHVGVVYDALGNKTWAKYHLIEAAAGPSDNPVSAKAKALIGG